MALAYYRNDLTDSLGNAVAGASVTVRQTGTATPITETIKTLGGATLTNPLTSGSDGSIAFALDVPKRVDLYIVASGLSPKTITVDVIAAGTLPADTDVVGSDTGGARLNFKPSHEDGYCQVTFWPEQHATQPDAIITVHKELAGTETNHRHMTFYTSPALGAAPTGRLDIEYGATIARALWSGVRLRLNTDSYWDLDPVGDGAPGDASFNGDFEVRGNATANSRGFKLVNTATNGHTWRISEEPGVGRLGFRDLTAAGQPVVIELDGTNKKLSIVDGGGIEFTTAVGGKIGMGATEKIGFYGATPAARATIAAAATDAATTQTLANDLRTKLINLGLVGA